MMAVDPTFADWLRSPALVSVATASSPFGALTQSSVITSCLAVKADADAEAPRQIDFLGLPRVVDKLRVEGRRADLIGKAVTLTAAHEGYRVGAIIFVVAAEEQDDGGTVLSVIRRLT